MSLTRPDDNHELDEETAPFLPDEEVRSHLKPKRTPLPRTQISILVTAWVAESVLSNSIGPYLNQLVRDLPEVGGDARKVGYYTGIIVALRCASEIATSFQLNRLSDHVGRKPVLLSSLAGATLAILLFGLSRSFWALVLTRCLHGAVMGHIGTVKSMISELTDETNVTQGFSMPQLAWSLGSVIGPLIGGIFSKPQDRWPHAFSHPFWGDYPYFLPCLIAAMFSCLSFTIIAIYLEETLNLRTSEKIPLASIDSDMLEGESGDSPDLDMLPGELQKPLPLRSVLTRPVVISVANYAMLALVNSVASSYFPLVWSTPVEFGGLNMDPPSIGVWLSLYGGVDGIFQILCFPLLVSRFGLRSVFVFAISSCIIIYAIFPLENIVQRMAGDGPNWAVWLLIILQLSALCVFDSGYGAMFIYLTCAAPNKRSLGTVVGLSQMVNSIPSTVGPAAAGWLYAFSLTHNIMGGNFPYFVLIGVVCAGLYVTTWLSKDAWTHRKT